VAAKLEGTADLLVLELRPPGDELRIRSGGIRAPCGHHGKARRVRSELCSVARVLSGQPLSRGSLLHPWEMGPEVGFGGREQCWGEQ
jgi:hypothetical protein